jgi:hypothetical protein
MVTTARDGHESCPNCHRVTPPNHSLPFSFFPTSPDFAGSLSTVDENNPTPAVHYRDSYFQKKNSPGNVKNSLYLTVN